MSYLTIGIIFILALFAIRFSNKHGIPALLLFIVLGMIFGIGIDFGDYEFADSFATVALMVIMFYGGFGTNWKMGKPVAKEAIVLSSLGVVATALITGLFCHYVLGLGLLEGMLIGSIVGSTDYASVSNILRSKNLNLKYNTASLLELESGSNDPTAFTMTMVFLSAIIGSKLSIPILVLSQVVLGIAMGCIFSFVIGKLLKNYSLESEGLYAVLMASIMLITYATTDLLGGNGYLALYILGIYLGNIEFKGKRNIIFFFDGFTEIMQIGLFFILGLLSDLNKFIMALPLALAIMLFMTIIARPVTVYGLMLPFRLKLNQLNIISLAGIRGAAAIAFAIMAVNSPAVLSVDIYHIVFGICVLSSLIQGGLMPFAAKRLKMLDPGDTVLKTFNYYQDKAEIGFLETRIRPNSSLIGKKVKDLNLTFDFIVAKIERNGKTIVPRGNVTIKENDLIVIAGEVHFDKTGQELTEFTISKGHKWQNKYIKDLELPYNNLIIMVQRKGSKIIVPVGDTLLLEDDKVIMIKVERSLEFTVANVK
ncbi:potassium/proton antiporter [Acetivibrio mesophilus]|uniref:Potassium/proton antiporter n=1 Tax=Acetivibrio mesophilus TaxID=2487273 RepID=A0A4Q0I2X5_9FIRM|nr:potassium/proton antiporter [Acetivibrio mesophilus]ODM27654.1 K+/H+ antiporter [Clostridium sp. Bc-iso-3]RXE58594.1 potassium/proton antiporter [Acetivibrio mesophilus]HHV30296.1 potassium/proton antiporter [Clostridium sp.]